MKVTVYGSGYVGLVTAACLAEVGNDVVCMYIDEKKIANLNNGIIPIYEPGLEALIKRNEKTAHIKFTTDAAEAVKHGLFHFIAVGTPSDEDGSADLQYVLAVAKTIATHIDDYSVIIDKSTVPVGTADKVKNQIVDILATRNQSIDFDVVSNPEFLKEGSAINDFMKPDRIVVGTDNPRTSELMKALYSPFNRNRDRFISMDIRSAELTKYAANAMLATKISFMNELSNLAERLGADIEQVRSGIGSDSRIGYSFIYPGCGYGGSCFPKDVKALVKSADEAGYNPELLDAVENVNGRQKKVLFHKVQAFFNNELEGKVFALWGLAFKPNTDDMREAASRVLLEALISAGATVRAYDPEAMEEAKRIYPDESKLILCDTEHDALNGADALVIVTEWKLFNNPDFNLIKQKLNTPVIFDGRNLYDPKMLEEMGFQYYAIGRGKRLLLRNEF